MKRSPCPTCRRIGGHDGDCCHWRHGPVDPVVRAKLADWLYRASDSVSFNDAGDVADSLLGLPDCATTTPPPAPLSPLPNQEG